MRSSLYLTEWHNCRRASVTAGTNGAGWQAPVTDSAIENPGRRAIRKRPWRLTNWCWQVMR